MPASILPLLPRPFLPPLWRELAAFDHARAGAAAVAGWPAVRCPQPVLLIPGFLAGDLSLQSLAHALVAAGHEPHTAGIRCNVRCSEAAVRRLGDTVEDLAEHSGRPGGGRPPGRHRGGLGGPRGPARGAGRPQPRRAVRTRRPPPLPGSRGL